MKIKAATPEFSQGVCQDGAAILMDGQPERNRAVLIEEAIKDKHGVLPPEIGT